MCSEVHCLCWQMTFSSLQVHQQRIPDRCQQHSQGARPIPQDLDHAEHRQHQGRNRHQDCRRQGQHNECNQRCASYGFQDRPDCCPGVSSRGRLDSNQVGSFFWACLGIEAINAKELSRKLPSGFCKARAVLSKVHKERWNIFDDNLLEEKREEIPKGLWTLL